MAKAWQSVEEAAITLGISARTLHRRVRRNEVETRLLNGRREVLVEVDEAAQLHPPYTAPGNVSATPSAPFSGVSAIPPTTTPPADPSSVRQTNPTGGVRQTNPTDVGTSPYQTNPSCSPQVCPPQAQTNPTDGDSANSGLDASDPTFGVSDNVSDSPPRPQPTTAQKVVEQEDTAREDAGVSQTMLMLHEDRLRRTDLAIMAYQQSVTVSAAEARRNRIGQRVAWSAAGAMVVALFLTVIWTTHRVTDAQAHIESLNKQVQSLSDTADAAQRDSLMQRRDAEFARTSAARAEGELSANRQRLKEQNDELEQIRQRQQQPQEPATRPSGLLERMFSQLMQPHP